MNWLSQGTTLLNSTMYLVLTGQDTETVMTCTDEHLLVYRAGALDRSNVNADM